MSVSSWWNLRGRGRPERSVGQRFRGREHTRCMLIAGASRNWCTRNSFRGRGQLAKSTLVETLSEHGWPLKDRNGRPNKDYGSAGLKGWATERVREARKWWQRNAMATDGPADRAWTTRDGSEYRRWISVMASEMKRARRGLGISRVDAAERAGFERRRIRQNRTRAEYRRTEKASAG